MCSSCVPVVIGMSSPCVPRTSRGVTSLPSPADSQGKRAPRSPRARAAGACRREAADAVLEHGPGRSRPDRGQRRQHEDVRVPKDVPGVGVAGQPPGADRGLAGRRAAAARRWKTAKRAASSDSGSPSITTSASAHRRAHASRCSASSASKPSGVRLGEPVTRPRRSSPRHRAQRPRRPAARLADGRSPSRHGPGRPRRSRRRSGRSGRAAPRHGRRARSPRRPGAAQRLARLEVEHAAPRPATPWRAATRPRRTASTGAQSRRRRSGRACPCAGRAAGARCAGAGPMGSSRPVQVGPGSRWPSSV